uniref:Uncharacterized protein n=1 Tax=Arundo donax TaxID=35708 RepID=A0A0A9BCX9_ARUDO
MMQPGGQEGGFRAAGGGFEPHSHHFWHLTRLPHIFPLSGPSQVNRARFSPV